ncbi:MAG: PASTA domain-containing protein [Eubacterium sp.]|nr:PASTA domain-containing protein [Eubacterium sp.]
MEKNGRKTMLKRMLILAVAIVFLFGIDAFRILYLQVAKGDEFKAKAESQQLSDTEVSAMRGTIYDSEGNVLAQSATVWNIFLDPSNIKDEETRNFVVDNLSKILGCNEEEKKEIYEKSKKKTRYVLVAEKIENDLKEKITKVMAKKENRKYKLSTIIGTEQTTRRYYPYGSFASPVLGFVGNDNQGLEGIESYYNKELTGTNGRIVTVKDSKGNKLPTDYETSIAAIDGNSLVLTIDQTIQYYLEKSLRQTLEEYQAKGTYGIVMDCNTGAVLAMSSLPDFDCNEPYKLTYNKNKKQISKLSDKKEKAQAESLAIQNQWRNFTVADTYVPGSVFKTFMTCAGLEENVVNLNTTYTCGGSIQVADRKMNCHYHPGHGTQDLTHGLMNSCNPFFITIGLKLGAHNYYKYFDAFGFTQTTGIDLPGEAAPQFYKEDQYTRVVLASASFGQSNSLTPIQVCTGLCAVANGGTLLKPYIVSEIKDAEGNTVKKTEPTEVRRVISEDTSAKVRKMMKAVVDEGTGKNGYVAGYSVGGKTGTSTKLGEFKEGEKTKYIVSFAAIAPADKPEIAMLIICDEPNADLGGGAICAPVAAQVVEQAMAVRNIEPKYDEKEAKTLSIKAPKVVGESVSGAKSRLKSNNLKCKIVGKGDKVLSQSPIAGSPIPSGGTVVVYTEKNMKKTVKVPDFTGLSVGEANSVAGEHGLNIEVKGSVGSSDVIAYRQSVDKGSQVEIGTVISVSFKNTHSVLD